MVQHRHHQLPNRTNIVLAHFNDAQYWCDFNHASKVTGMWHNSELAFRTWHENCFFAFLIPRTSISGFSFAVPFIHHSFIR